MTLVLLLAATAAVHGQTVNLSADTIALGDQTTLSISGALKYPSAQALTQNGIEAIRQDFDTATRTQTTVLTSFEPGEHWLRLGDDDSLLIVVNDVEIDSATAELRDIAPIERVPYTFWEIFRWVLLVWAIAAVAIVVWWMVERRRKHGSILVHREPEDTRTPLQRALDNLEQLRTRQLWQQGKVKEYHTELTDAVRRFIEESTDIRATDLTSDETVESVENGSWGAANGELARMLRDIFRTADLVKFAKGEPLPHEHERSMAEAVEFVNSLWKALTPTEESREEARP